MLQNEYMTPSNQPPKFKIGDVVLMMDPDQPFLGFQRQRVVEVIEREDGYHYVTEQIHEDERESFFNGPSLAHG